MHRMQQGSTEVIALEAEARKGEDPNLVAIVAQVRLRGVTTTAQRNT